MQTDLSILCVTKNEERAQVFLEHFRNIAMKLGAELVIAVDGIDVHSPGYLEPVLDEAIALTHGTYVLRLDDDEAISPAMMAWLEMKSYKTQDNWAFPRVHLWKDSSTIIDESPYFPDFQVRLSKRELAGRPAVLHAASPHPCYIAQVCIEHWTFLVKSYEERAAISKQYQDIANGLGSVNRGGSIEDEHAGRETELKDYGGGCTLRGQIPWKARTWKEKLR
jgi:hypothetical protein